MLLCMIVIRIFKTVGPRFLTPDHLCFRRTTYDNINGPGGTIYVVIFGPAGPLMYPDQISRYRTHIGHQIASMGLKLFSLLVSKASLRPLGLSGPIVDATQTHRCSKQCLHGCFATCNPTLPHSTTHTSPIPPSPYLRWPETSAHLKHIKILLCQLSNTFIKFEKDFFAIIYES